MTSLDLEHPPACYSDLMLDRFIVGELDGDPRRVAIHSHLETCVTCRERRTALELAQRNPPEDSPRAPAAPRPELVRRWPRILGVGALTAGIVALSLLARSPSPAPVSNAVPDVLQLKGSAIALDVVVRRHATSRTESAVPGEAFGPGDALRFRVRSPRAGYLVLMGRDVRGQWSQYLPAPGDAVQVAAGETTLERSLELDDALGQEDIVAVLCGSRANALQAIAVERSAVEPSSAAPFGPDCSEVHFPYRKARAP